MDVLLQDNEDCVHNPEFKCPIEVLQFDNVSFFFNAKMYTDCHGSVTDSAPSKLLLDAALMHVFKGGR